MGVSKHTSGRWRAVLKNGRTYVQSKNFDTRREAEAWLARERAALVGGVDPRAGQIIVRKAFAAYMESRRHTVAVKTYRSDMEMVDKAGLDFLNRRGHIGGTRPMKHNPEIP